jgi:hypothetical protein
MIPVSWSANEALYSWSLCFLMLAFEIETSTHYGRMVRLDDKVLLFTNPEDAAEYLGFEPPEEDGDDEPQLPG